MGSRDGSRKSFQLLPKNLQGAVIFQFLPEIRKTLRQPSHEGLLYMLKYGNAEDYRYIRQITKEDMRTGTRLGSSRIYDQVKANIENSKNPLAVPILVDFLDRREIHRFAVN